MEETPGASLSYLWLFAVVGGPIILGVLMAIGVRRSRLRGKRQGTGGESGGRSS